MIKTISPEIFSKTKQRTYLLEKQVSSGSNSSDDEKDNNKSSKFSSKLAIKTDGSNIEKEDNENHFRYSLISILKL